MSCGAYSMKSLCPICRRLFETRGSVESGKVYMERTCPEHGSSRILVSTDAIHWTKSMKYNRAGGKRMVWSSTIEKGCPEDCDICPARKQHTCVSLWICCEEMKKHNVTSFDLPFWACFQEHARFPEGSSQYPLQSVQKREHLIRDSQICPLA
jgi:uncharacterized radical SAM superfamily Fe-S cluster-containing enzyme